jgi:SAM-dependent methyltransferase
MDAHLTSKYGDWEQWHWWFRGRRKIIEKVLRRKLAGPGPRRLLSVGCGPAEGLEWLLPFAGPGGKVFGLDLEPQHAQSIPEQIEFVVGRVERTPLTDSYFDVILALDVFEHLDDDQAALREAVRLLKPGGLLLLTVPALPSLWGRQDIASEHRRRYTKQSLSDLLDQVQWSDCQIDYFNTFLFPLALTVRWSRRALGLASCSRSDFEDNRPGVINEVLAWIFSAERHLINRVAMPIGVSLSATCKVPESAVPSRSIEQ